MTQAARKVSHPIMIIILTWASVRSWGTPLTSISLIVEVILSRVAIVSLHYNIIYKLYK